MLDGMSVPLLPSDPQPEQPPVPLNDLSSLIARCIDDVELALNAERSRFRSIQLMKVQATLQDLYALVDGARTVHAIRE
jgi:hypothetical protein